MNKTNQSRMNTMYITQMGLLSAVIVLMAFTPLGYLRVGIFSITFIMIPVAIGAIVHGAKAGAVLGGVFGVTSFIQAFTAGGLATLLLNIDPIRMFIMCVIPRILMGFGVGLIFKLLSANSKGSYVKYLVASSSSALLNTLFFIPAMGLLFYDTIADIASKDGGTVMSFLLAFLSINSVVELIVAGVVGTVVSKQIHRFVKR